MSTDLTMLALSALFTVALTLFNVLPLIYYQGLAFGMGNRGALPNTQPEWTERALRAQKNMQENLLPFAALVLVAQAAGVSNENTAWGATLFFWARLAHAGIYIAGIPYLRTVAFVVSLRGMFGIARELF